jgi:phospholipid/cholesterol/gamma-HCH transport system substrate-binding protein
MSGRGVRDFTVGLFVLVALSALAYLSLSVGGLTYTGPGGLTLFATFDQIADLKPRAVIKIGGVAVGRVTSIWLAEDYRARVELELDAGLELPVDTSASVVTSGLLGDRYIALEPGAEDEVLRDGDDISFTESAIVLERMIGKFLVNVDDEETAGTGKKK